MIITRTFEDVKSKREIAIKCCECKKTLKRKLTTGQTLNPYNKNKDGSVKDRRDIYAENEIELDKQEEKIKSKNIICKTCEKKSHNSFLDVIPKYFVGQNVWSNSGDYMAYEITKMSENSHTYNYCVEPYSHVADKTLGVHNGAKGDSNTYIPTSLSFGYVSVIITESFEEAIKIMQKLNEDSRARKAAQRDYHNSFVTKNFDYYAEVKNMRENIYGK